jgi:hypothetical protein
MTTFSTAGCEFDISIGSTRRPAIGAAYSTVPVAIVALLLSLGPCPDRTYFKLIESGFPERKAIVIFGYEHSSPLIDITIAIEAFEAIASQVVGIELVERQWAKFSLLIHFVHQQGKVFG